MPSTTNKLDIAFTNVSTVEIVSDNPSTIINKDNKEVYRSIGETTKELIYDALNTSI